ncbi:MAG: polynucleotide adenylyltransferase PcnB [Planctomycetota bacterium]|nr:polynucleotide adenylyltransferase PcnB [Planctomycetota bacterium]
MTERRMTEPLPEASPAEDAAERSLRVVASNGLVPQVDENALRVISRLDRHGFEAYLVGGCVRDLMLGRSPKDFDVATAAHPRQIKRLFRNGRIIGRRFRLVHVVYGDQVVETATFRSEPPPGDEPDDLLITEDNEFGTSAEDARRRDFTINALFLDPLRDEILDYIGGLEDLEAGLLRTIGEPRVRIAEDPVRIVRAVKFATRLGFRIEDSTWLAMCELAPQLSRSAPPRVFEEIVRLLCSGTALGAFRMLRACGALRVLLPEVDGFLGARNDPDPAAHDRADSYWRLLEALDAYVHDGHVPTRALCMAVLYLRVIEQRAPGGNAAGSDVLARTAYDVLQPFGSRARVARRILGRAGQIIANQPRFTQAPSKRFRPLLFMRSDAFEESLSLFRLRSAAWGQGWDVYEGWTERYRQLLEDPAEEIEPARARRRGGRRRGRRRRRTSDPPPGTSTAETPARTDPPSETEPES